MIKDPIKVGDRFNTTNCGMIEVIQVINSKKILARFDNTGVEKWTFSSCLRKGNIHDPSLPRTSPNKPSIKVGDIFPTNYHGDIEVLKYNSGTDVLVKFLNTGDEIKSSVTRIYEGVLKPPGSAAGKPNIEVPFDMQPGYLHKTKNYGELKVITYHHAKCVDVKFVETGYNTTASAHEIRNGEVWDKIKPIIHAIGYHGVGPYKSTYTDGNNPFEPGRVKCRAYFAWSNMLTRCYSEKNQLRQPSYKGVIVVEEWHNFQNFAKWYYAQNWKGMQLDKDLLCGGNGKVYGPSTCSMIPEGDNKALNRAININKTSTGKFHLATNLTIDTVDEAVEILTELQLNIRNDIFHRLKRDDPFKDDARSIIHEIIRKRIK
ncbi:hypothetical protein L4D76_15615 [Photobacterium sagamiensis]|uniref:hypothetical protein n=1 Tax=Photobacterium sagamiensis TaxID=2910241 RepID=UPI003D0ADDCD